MSARAFMVLLMPLAASRSVALIYVVAAAMGVFSALFNPSQVKVVGELIPGEGLVKANSYLSIARDGAELGGYLVGGALVALVGYSVTFVIDAGSYLISAVLLFGLPINARFERAGAGLLRLLRESPRAVDAIWRSRALRTNALLALGPMLVIVMGTPAAYGLALDVFGRGSSRLCHDGGADGVRVDPGGDGGYPVGLQRRSQLVRGRLPRRYGIVFRGSGIGRQLLGLRWSCWRLAAAANVGAIVGSMTLLQELPPRPDKGRIIAVRIGFGQIAATGGLLLGGVDERGPW